jgi:predicted nucleic acid-binding protein
MKIVISDSSSLILLSKSFLIETILEFFEIIIPSVVYDEILKGKQKNHIDAFEIEQLVKDNKIKIKNPDQKAINILKNNYNLDVGELHAISLAKEHHTSIFIDDKKGIIVCKLLDIETYTVINLLKILYVTKTINKTKLKMSIDILKENARYTKEDLKEIINMVDDYE